MADAHKPEAEDIRVIADLSTTPNTSAAINLFATLLRVVREEEEEQRQKQDHGKSAA
jgi:hypothetical protein